MPKLELETIVSPLKTAFAISRGAKTSADTVRVTLSDGPIGGRGECVPYGRYGESTDSVAAQIEAISAHIEAGMDRAGLQEALPAGAARCAVDCALWDLQAKRENIPVYKLAGLPEPAPCPVTMTLSLDTPENMATAAGQTSASILKLKLGGAADLVRVEAVHAARPDAKLVLDGNEGLDEHDFDAIAARGAELGVTMIEQPFPAGADQALLLGTRKVSICADESVHTRKDIPELADKYDAINIKIDKAGGLTEGLAMARAARELGLGIMIGCMVGGSLSMAPAFLLGAHADIVDLDGPLWLQNDIENGLVFRGGLVYPPTPALWG